MGIGILLTDDYDDDYDEENPALWDIAPYSVEPANILPIGGWFVANDIWIWPDDKTFFENWDIDECELVIEDVEDLKLAIRFYDTLTDETEKKTVINAIERYKNETRKIQIKT